jgi:ankyrin repeat protein
MTGLHWAAKRGHYTLCEILIKNHSDINAFDVMGRSPLYFSILGQNFNVFQLLL